MKKLIKTIVQKVRKRRPAVYSPNDHMRDTIGKVKLAVRPTLYPDRYIQENRVTPYDIQRESEAKNSQNT